MTALSLLADVRDARNFLAAQAWSARAPLDLALRQYFLRSCDLRAAIRDGRAAAFDGSAWAEARERLDAMRRGEPPAPALLRLVDRLNAEPPPSPSPLVLRSAEGASRRTAEAFAPAAGEESPVC